MQDTDIEHFLKKKVAVLREQPVTLSLAPAVVQVIRRQQQLKVLRPLLVLVATGLGLLLSLPAVLGVLDLSAVNTLVLQTLQVMQQTGDEISTVATLWLPQIASPLIGGLVLMVLLGGVAVASEA